ncbi:Gfo/Idh/MocA family protein [Desertihabitans aurantiacus]|uniref:Gfo/Idh/MocA family protein n=1 Tax=Desertihabitans aurantiacus TaxID=2282477 RepID=UPI000DF82821|nr:Gfo/Idh/MocA family oxidoreductase [Desertihabitans aurantiacus]
MTQTVALIGAGGIAQVHLPAWLALGAQVRVHSVAGSSELVARHGGGTVAGSLEEALDGADVVDVCTPTPTHPGIVAQAAERGASVLCEKPLALTVAEAAEMIRVCRDAGVQLYPGHVVRFFPEYATMHRAVESGAIGPVAVQRFTRAGSRPRADWFADPALSGGIVLDQMIHDLDFAVWNAGPVRDVFARRASTPDTDGRRGVVSAQVVLTHRSGALSYVTGTWAAPGTTFRTSFEVVGTEGLLTHDSAAAPPVRVDGGGGAAGTGLLPATVSGESPYLTEIREIAAAFAGGPAPRVRAEDGLVAVQVATAANESLRTGAPVAVEPLPEDLLEVTA